MSIYEPEAVESQGATKIKLLSAVVDAAAASLATEVNAASSVEATLVFNTWNPTRTPNTGTAPRRVGTRDQFPREGNMQYQPIAITYPDDPQADTGDPNVKAKDLLTEGTVKYVLVRKGIDVDTAFAADQKYELWKVRCGAQIETQSGEDEFAEYQIQQNLYPLQKVAKGVIAA
ncbi:hypothetical protein [Nocardioides aquiterrae]|uniref:Phage tail protein n=1 Tax=Nocardioides aquiterrae TaxID=203799 RepID=A0ABP4EZA7_9ACTN